ncbi:condensation domain-containing protein [Actinacidiphila bryophytorum]|uniref:condensation domain-containing protein n=1 Tax=Actinacidiphila bryophytorum TaxID=1436133 RepID=UPI0021769BFA|nr:condensation domain-containing protein [Actinacidiphila bryophytorum]UWE12568.1 condensation domain-containing protein [Actinacidiphila bryophytorum]
MPAGAGAPADTDTRVSWQAVPFRAEGGSGPVTWGQLHMWHPMLRYGAAFATLSLRQVVALPAPGVEVGRCLDAIRELTETHQALRTRFADRSGTGDVRQDVAADGTHLVEVYETGEHASDGAVAAVAERRGRKLAAEPFRHSHEWPVRFGLVCRGRQVRAVAVVCSHVAFDAWAADLVCGALRRLLTGEPAPQGSTWQPLDQAAHERSERGLREDARAVRHWRARLAEVPDAAPRPPLDPPAAPPIQQWWLTSNALAAASVAVAERTRTSTSAVLLTLAATALSAIRGQRTVPLKLIAGNRLTDRQQRLATSAAQDALLVFERGDVGLDEAVREVYRRSTSGYMRGSYDPRSLSALTAELNGERRHPLDLTGYFNDARLAHAWALPPGPAARSSRGPTFVRGYDRNDMSFCVVLAQQGPDCQVSVLADTTRLPADRIPVLLSGLESVLSAAATQDIPLPSIPSSLGLPPP